MGMEAKKEITHSQCRKHMIDSQPVTWQEIKEIVPLAKVLTLIGYRDSHKTSILVIIPIWI